MKFQEPQLNTFNLNTLLSVNSSFFSQNQNPYFLPMKESIRLELEDKELWSSFSQFTNEMILTKAGRRLFPLLRFSISGLEDSALYTIQIEFKYSDNFKYRFVSGEWRTANRTESIHSRSQGPIVYEHPDSPNYGHHWSKDHISFTKLKLTNNENHNKKDLIFLKSLCKYDPLIHVYKHDKSNIESKELIYSKCFTDTRFIAVTAYQNEQITKLKIAHNPFAKAFLNNKPLITIENDQVITTSIVNKTEEPVKVEISKQETSDRTPVNTNVFQNWYQNYYPQYPIVNPYQNYYTRPNYNYQDHIYNQYYYNQYQNQSFSYNNQFNDYNSSLENTDLSSSPSSENDFSSNKQASSPLYNLEFYAASKKRSLDPSTEEARPNKKIDSPSTQYLGTDSSHQYPYNNSNCYMQNEAINETTNDNDSSASSFALSNSSIN